jgi:hypothetical protein
VSAESVGRDMAKQAIEAGIASGLHYAVGFLAGCGAAFADHGKTDLAQAFTAAAGELGRVEPSYVRSEDEAAINAEAPRPLRIQDLPPIPRGDGPAFA